VIVVAPLEGLVDKEALISSITSLHTKFIEEDVKVSFVETMRWGKSAMSLSHNCRMNPNVAVSVVALRSIVDSLGGHKRRGITKSLLDKAGLPTDLSYSIERPSQ
jgi:hypothetical protein